MRKQLSSRYLHHPVSYTHKTAFGATPNAVFLAVVAALTPVWAAFLHTGVMVPPAFAKPFCGHFPPLQQSHRKREPA